jgi:hypothetical protein
MNRDTSHDTPQREHSDRRLWLRDGCPRCTAQPGARCRTRSLVHRKPSPLLTLHAARGWRQRPCPACEALPGEPCLTPRGRPAAGPHSARLSPARGELGALEDVWHALERAGAELALVCFSGGGGRQGTLEAITIHAGERQLAHWWGAGDSGLASALAAPVWGRYGTFRGQPRIAATLRWSVADRSLLLTGTRGTERFKETFQAAAATDARTVRDMSRDMSQPAGTARERLHQAGGGEAQAAGRECCRCGQPIPASARPEARYCGKRCRQAASRARLREQSGRSALAAPERCAFCDGPMPTGLRPEARYCGKRCRQAASRARLAHAHKQHSGVGASVPPAPGEQLRLR